MKTVFILGAGFSIDAGVPAQTQLMKKTFEHYDNNNSNFDSAKFSKFKNFLLNRLHVSESQFHHVELEDIFTPLDSCLSNNAQFRGMSIAEIIEVRDAVFYVVSRTIQLVLNNSIEKNKEYIDKFAKYLVEKSSNRINGNYKHTDPVSVISTNWDTLLDNSLYSYISNNKSKYDDAVVDYCCYISSLNENDNTIKPGLEVLGRGGFNIKLLKLHGSLNWLQCSRCMRLYVNFSSEENMVINQSCRHCDNNHSEEKGNHQLASNLIMPTFIKDLSNPQYKIIWQNAGIEISEADKIVFIGYSLPSADFEMRQLLSRMTRKKASIEIVDYSGTDCHEKKENLEKHWKNFFGDRDVKLYFCGASKYIKSLVSFESEKDMER